MVKRLPLWLATGSLVAATAIILSACRDDWLREDPVVRPPAEPPPPLPPAVMPLSVEQAMDFIRPMEGRRTKAYKDTRRVPTIGVGFNLRRGKLAQERLAAVGVNYKAVLRGVVELNDAQIEMLFRWDVVDAFRAARRVQPGFDAMPPAVQAVVVDIIFNLGPTGYCGFDDARRALATGRWRDAAGHLARSDWARQVPDRAKRNLEILASVA